MKVMLLMWTGREEHGGERSDWQAWQDFEAAAREAGVYVDGGQFTSTDDAHVVRTALSNAPLDDPQTIRAGTAAASDLTPGGYYLIDVAAFDDALGWAHRLPLYGEVEVRAIQTYDF